jgi:predicted ribosomally synthesized peptide with nif11-like leader
MSKENAKKFAEELMSSKKLQKLLEKQKPASLEDVTVFAATHKFSFTADELKETIDELKALQISDDVLEKIYAGAIPTPVNGQITDAVT